MNVESLLAKLKGVRRSGGGWQATCPAHPDKNPSLSVTVRGEKILLFCHAGCSVESICAASKINVSDLFSESRRLGPERPWIVREVERQVANLRSRLSPRERVLPVTVVFCDAENLEAGIVRALALAVEEEIVQAVLDDQK
jgi:hypothetical protein